MRGPVKIALCITIIYGVIAWIILPGAASRMCGNFSIVRLDPRFSKDYNCIFVEGHTADRFLIPWLCHSIPLDYLRIRYTPNDSQQDYGIMFIDPRTLAFESHNYCAKGPIHLAGRLGTSQPILDWMRSQPHSLIAPSHTNDAVEVFGVVQKLRLQDLEHFSLPAGYPTTNFVVGFQSIAKNEGPSISTCLPLVLIWLPVISKISRAVTNAK